MSKWNDNLDIKNYTNWVGSLFGKWWIFILALLFVSLASGFTSFLLFTGLAVMSFILWTNSKGYKHELLFQSAMEYFKSWWKERPSSKK